MGILLKIVCILVGIGLFFLIVFLVHQAQLWQVFEGEIRGTKVMGDPKASPTRWWNHLYLRLWGWKKVVVYRLNPSNPAVYDVYYIGYRPLRGPARITGVKWGSYVRLRIGHEPCTFFALDLEQRELSLEFVGIFDKADYLYANIPLL